MSTDSKLRALQRRVGENASPRFYRYRCRETPDGKATHYYDLAIFGRACLSIPYEVEDAGGWMVQVFSREEQGGQFGALPVGGPDWSDPAVVSLEGRRAPGLTLRFVFSDPVEAHHLVRQWQEARSLQAR